MRKWYLVHKYDEISCSVHHGGHPASHHGPPVGEGHGGASLSLSLSVFRFYPAVVLELDLPAGVHKWALAEVLLVRALRGRN